MEDHFDLQRFVTAQAGSYDAALAEIGQGAKRTHWMWYIFPQYAGLGHSAVARSYAIQSLAEARAYLAHPVLGPRLRACITALQRLRNTTAEQIFGEIDAIKLRSSLTLFMKAGREQIFQDALDRWFGGSADALTLNLIAKDTL